MNGSDDGVDGGKSDDWRAGYAMDAIETGVGGRWEGDQGWDGDWELTLDFSHIADF